MKNRTAKRKWIFISAALLITALVVAADGVFSARRQQPSLPQEQPRVTSMPPVFSKVKKLEVVRTWIVDAGTPAMRAAVEVRNNSDKAVMAVDLVSGEGGVTRNGLTDEEHPIVVIPPHGTTTLEMTFASMTFGAPLVVAAVTYADGTEEGDAASLKAMHQVRAHGRAQIKAEKERRAQKRTPTP
jgi:hypothetical protein